MNWLSNMWKRPLSGTECLTKAVIKLWMEEPDEWTEKRTKCFSIHGGMSDGYLLTHKTHNISIRVGLFMGPEHGPHYQDDLFSVYAGLPILCREELKRIADAVTETRPHRALAKYRAKIAAARMAQTKTIATLTEIGCPSKP